MGTDNTDRFVAPKVDSGLRVLEAYARELKTGAQGFPGDLEFGFIISDGPTAYNRLVAGMTTFCRACLDVAFLFRAAAEARTAKQSLEKHIVAVLFEIRNSLGGWVPRAASDLYNETKREPSRITQLRRSVFREFEPHLSAMKEIRDRVFHRHHSHDDDAVDYVVGLMYERKIPGHLHKALVAYGVDLATAMWEDGIGIPGIGCFGVIPVEGAARMKLPFDHPYMPRKEAESDNPLKAPRRKITDGV